MHVDTVEWQTQVQVWHWWRCWLPYQCPYSTASTQEHGLQFRLRLAAPKLDFNIIHHVVEVGSCFYVYVYLAFSDSHIVIVLSVETSAAWFKLAHGMSHLCATMGILPVIFIVFFTPTRWRSRTATTTWIKHGCGSINIPCKRRTRLLYYKRISRKVPIKWRHF